MRSAQNTWPAIALESKATSPPLTLPPSSQVPPMAANTPCTFPTTVWTKSPLFNPCSFNTTANLSYIQELIFEVEKSLDQALFLCNICVVFRPVMPFGKLLFIHTLTNATDDHKYSPLPSADFDSSEVLVSFSAFIFS